jgi:KDO2-lipid IV(A) lauroyltransferase
MTGAAIVPCFVIRLGRRFRLVIEEPIPQIRTGDRAHDILAITQAWSRVVESYIRCYPEQWVWMHRRWKTQPASREGAAGRRHNPVRV